mmetsp:Transcript_94974/g.263894  ORF Transcript_94974/g.263894 Transcript_94974/m.263894 type:complete len:307 (-) Transcript_94974:55-975(-)
MSGACRATAAFTACCMHSGAAKGRVHLGRVDANAGPEYKSCSVSLRDPHIEPCAPRLVAIAHRPPFEVDALGSAHSLLCVSRVTPLACQRGEGHATATQRARPQTAPRSAPTTSWRLWRSSGSGALCASAGRRRTVSRPCAACCALSSACSAATRRSWRRSHRRAKPARWCSTSPQSSSVQTPPSRTHEPKAAEPLPPACLGRTAARARQIGEQEASNVRPPQALGGRARSRTAASHGHSKEAADLGRIRLAASSKRGASGARRSSPPRKEHSTTRAASGTASIVGTPTRGAGRRPQAVHAVEVGV